MRWILNGNGKSYLTEAEQNRVTSSDNKELRFMSSTGHGFIASDGEKHLYTGLGCIIADWGDDPPAPTLAPTPVPSLAQNVAQSVASGDAALTQLDYNVIAQIVDHAVEGAIMRVLGRIANHDDGG